MMLAPLVMVMIAMSTDLIVVCEAEPAELVLASVA